LLLGLTAWANEHLSERMPARDGETCHICNGKVGKGDAAYLASGQRVALHAADCCEGKFLKDSQVHTASLRPNSIQAVAVAGVGLASRWMWFGIYVLAGLVFGGFTAHLAVRKGYSPAGWFLRGFVLLGGAYLYLCRKPARPGASSAPVGLAKVPLTSQPVACPACGEPNHPSASQCLACGGRMLPRVASEVEALKHS
jgi:hypothetical protein